MEGLLSTGLTLSSLPFSLQNTLITDEQLNEGQYNCIMNGALPSGNLELLSSGAFPEYLTQAIMSSFNHLFFFLCIKTNGTMIAKSGKGLSGLSVLRRCVSVSVVELASGGSAVCCLGLKYCTIPGKYLNKKDIFF